jgi:hypothetical protein
MLTPQKDFLADLESILCLLLSLRTPEYSMLLRHTHNVPVRSVDHLPETRKCARLSRQDNDARIHECLIAFRIKTNHICENSNSLLRKGDHACGYLLQVIGGEIA